MNKPNNMKGRQRGRNGGKPRPMGGGGGGGRNPNYDGGQRMRGNAQQLMEKYLSLARDASSAGDRVLAENYFQHADHYYRVLNARFEQQQQNGNGQRRFEGGQGQDRNYNGDNGQGFAQDRPYEGEQGNRYNYAGQNNGGQNNGGQNNGNQSHGNQSHGHQNNGHQNNGGQNYGQGQDYNAQGHADPAQQPQPAPQPVSHTPQQSAPERNEPRQDANGNRSSDGEIGLPPAILGIGPAPVTEAHAPAAESGEPEGGRQQGRRRRGRGDRPFAGGTPSE